ncbi:MAG: FAD-dependent oxidoreductase, partial [Alphaproteobacteria bacterium]|nr:FAD-dependent oxidoreductase [Alphaproteobacteria bacterium]
EVTVLERAQLARGATWASAGMIAAAAEIGSNDTPEGRLAHNSAALWPKFAQEIEAASDIGIGFRQDGTLIIARSDAEAAELQRRASTERRFLLANKARGLEPLLGEDVAGALLDLTEAQVDNRALGPALAVAFQRAGGKLQVNEPVVRIEVENGRAVAARTPFHMYRADAFVLAAGAWSSRIEGLPPEAVPPIIPVKGEMLALAPRNAAPPKRMIWGNGIYMLTRHGQLLLGATVTREGFDTRTTKQSAESLLERASAVIPGLTGWDVVEHWAGLRPGSLDDRPLIGPSALEGLFVASGQYRNGILFAPAIAELMRDIVLNGAAPEPTFDPRRFAKVEANA